MAFFHFTFFLLRLLGFVMYLMNHPITVTIYYSILLLLLCVHIKSILRCCNIYQKSTQTQFLCL